jgi:hypothetical protein
MKAGALCFLCFLVAAIGFAGCFYPPLQKPPNDKQGRVVLSLPYDLAWNAVNAVIAKNGYRVVAHDPNHGIIETETNHFTLQDADCGQLKGVVGKYAAEPGQDASAVYNFHLKPNGKESSLVSVQATYSAPLHVPFHPLSDVQCVSRGVEEARLLKEIAQQAKETHRPTFKEPQS